MEALRKSKTYIKQSICSYQDITDFTMLLKMAYILDMKSFAHRYIVIE